jgi:hypothetical protein
MTRDGVPLLLVGGLLVGPAAARAVPQDAVAGEVPETPPVFYETTTVTARPVSLATGSVTVVGPE